MILLAIDTALAACSVAVLDTRNAGERLFTVSEELGRGHAERLMDMVDQVMAEAGVAFEHLTRIVVTTGPGSFTGLRVGISVARGLALVLGIPVVGVTTLEAIAAGALHRGEAAMLDVVLDARGNEVYHQRFDGRREPLTAPGVTDAQRLAANLPPNACLAGSGARKVAALAGLGGDCIVTEAAWPAIGDVARLGHAAEADGKMPVPLYLRPPDARPQVSDERLRV
ncbi:tRNA (adenosine(37)-N6)-threonylcarbamoyltransferase complex dimerization subunit type 1 TsaB [Stappia sp. F7233]|uniref:tRNA (Adenosine(37)-N6)-threonylcarbamoyltransferase complex dimerization subunit type 1 TsaB n=1 Tax=Stappia albiluteola TaxID=2758565 RepID=A0A839AAZ0_9HYPH|nr:tRNA (adenosine(37)-N6)-threonylcarbamoyltransferase complex dimerization subunit type 1 TsaB [Stappia albiluteola]MBA5776077.1 tRNA (adenosine(37)-N6)-threonylcarbamoyltransferase complex dimerization subunit type 1 TsaB [Stappia albiluteola]